MIYHGNDIDQIVNQLKERLFQNFSDCGENYTIIIYLWTDKDFKVECRYGRQDLDDNWILHIWNYHKNEITYTATELNENSSLKATESDNINT